MSASAGTTAYYLPAGLPAPVPEPDGLDTPYWRGTRRGELWVQRCNACRAWQWGPSGQPRGLVPGLVRHRPGRLRGQWCG